MNIKKVTPDAVASMQLDYFKTLIAPQDAYWQEGLIAAADHFEIHVNERLAGYCVLNDESQLMQFHVNEKRDAATVFKHVLELKGISAALASTIEPEYFCLCLDYQVGAAVHSYLFSDDSQCRPELDSITGHVFRPATNDDLPQVLSLLTGGDEFVDLETVDAHFEGPLGYARTVIEAGILHVLEKEGELLGTGEFRERKTWPPYADVGMIVNKNYRRQGIGTYLLCLLKQKAEGMGLKPICSCEAGNVGSRKAVENAGFIANHRVVEFSFETT